MRPLLPDNCTISAETNYEVDKVYVILAVATAVLCFFLNATQFVVIIHQGLLKRNKNIVIINLCVCGQLSSLTVVWYLYKVLLFWQEGRLVDNYLLCFLLPSGLHLLTLFTFTPLITLLVLQHHLVTRPQAYRRFNSSQLVVGLLVLLAWCEAVIISLIPLTGWNSWHEICSFPYAWSPSFSAFVCIIYFLHYPMMLILLTDLCFFSSKRRRSVCPQILANDVASLTLSEENPSCYDEPKSLGLKNMILLFILYMAGTMPFVCYTAYVALHQEMDLCQSLVANEKAAMWTSWLTVVFAAIRPLFHIMVEDDLGDGTTDFMATICRWKKLEYL